MPSFVNFIDFGTHNEINMLAVDILKISTMRISRSMLPFLELAKKSCVPRIPHALGRQVGPSLMRQVPTHTLMIR